MQDALILSIKDNSENIIWDAANKNDDEYKEIISQLSEDMINIYPNWKGQYEADEFPIRVNLTKIGMAEKISKGNFKGRIKSSTSIADINKLEVKINDLAKSLENQELLLKRLISDIAHELRAPIATLQSHFERFYRADPSRNRLTGGAGIGLTICKVIIEAHEGQIDVESKINEGTIFKIYLPINNSSNL